MSTEELAMITEAIAGSESAFDDLYRHYERLVYYIAYKNTKNDADAKDVVQETFLEVKRTIHTLQNPQAFKYWLNRITLSKCKNLFRKNHYINVDCEQPSIENNNIESRTYLIPHANSRKDSDCTVINQFISELPKGQREVLVMFYLEELHLEEISQRLDIPLGTVKSRLSYARDTLKDKVKKYEAREGIKLNFHSLGEGITAALLLEAAQTHIPAVLPIIPTESSTTGVSSFFSSTVAVKLTTAGIILFSTLTAGSYAYDYYQQTTASNQEDVSVTEAFPTFQVFNKQISTSESAYFNLKLWLCCEEEINALTKAEFLELQPIYEELKKLNNNYYQSLQAQGLTVAFEKLYKKFHIE